MLLLAHGTKANSAFKRNEYGTFFDYCGSRASPSIQWFPFYYRWALLHTKKIDSTNIFFFGLKELPNFYKRKKILVVVVLVGGFLHYGPIPQSQEEQHQRDRERGVVFEILSLLF